MMRFALRMLLLATVPSGYASFLGDQQEEFTMFAHDDHRIRRILLERRLDEDSPVAQPAEVCSAYNKALAGVMECSCQRFGSTDVQIYCKDVVETCVADQSSCLIRSIDTIITSDSASRVTTSCTNSTTVEDLNSCVQIFPISPGNYGGIEKCTATLNDQLCQSCSECEDKRNTVRNSTAITVNCCNVKEGAIQTCAIVGPLGGFLSYYDAGDGTCTSGVESWARASWAGWMFATFGSLWLLLC